MVLPCAPSAAPPPSGARVMRPRSAGRASARVPAGRSSAPPFRRTRIRPAFRRDAHPPRIPRDAHACASCSSCSRLARMCTMPPITIIAGEENPLRPRSSAAVGRVSSPTTRCAGVVACAIAAAGVSGAMPPRWRAARDGSDRAHRHVEHDRLAELRERGPSRSRPAESRGIVRGLAGGQHHRPVDPRAWWPGIAAEASPASPAVRPGDHPERDAGLGQRERLLAAAAEHERICRLSARSTRTPVRASSTRRAEMSACSGDGRPPPLARELRAPRGRGRVPGCRDRPARRRPGGRPWPRPASACSVRWPRSARTGAGEPDLAGRGTPASRRPHNRRTAPQRVGHGAHPAILRRVDGDPPSAARLDDGCVRDRGRPRRRPAPSSRGGAFPDPVTIALPRGGQRRVRARRAPSRRASGPRRPW